MLRSALVGAFLALCVVVIQPAGAQSAPGYDPISAAAADAGTFLAISQYATAQNHAALIAWVAEHQPRSQIQAALARRTTSVAPIPTGHAGPHSDAWWHGVAICEQGGRNDPYFGYFSFMDGSQGGRPWADQVAAGNALLARAGREVGPWAAKCVAAGYSASPGG